MSGKKATAADSNQMPPPPVEVCLLDDQPVNVDAFGGHQRVASAVAELIRKEDGGKAIALEGGWGSGKSSVVCMLEKELEHDNVRLLSGFPK